MEDVSVWKTPRDSVIKGGLREENFISQLILLLMHSAFYAIIQCRSWIGRRHCHKLRGFRYCGFQQKPVPPNTNNTSLFRTIHKQIFKQKLAKQLSKHWLESAGLMQTSRPITLILYYLRWTDALSTAKGQLYQCSNIKIGSEFIQTPVNKQERWGIIQASI